MDWNKCAKLIATAAGAVWGRVSGEWNALLTALACCMVLDYITGVIAAACGRSPRSEGGGLSSDVGFRGLAKKAVILLVIALATLLDRATDTAVFQTAAVFYYIANEGLSILENAALIGVPVPQKLKDALEVLKDRKEE